MSLLNDGTLTLRALEPEDVDALYEWENLSEYWRQGCTLAPYSRENLRRYIDEYRADPFATGELRLMAETVATHARVGLIDLYDVEVRHRRAFIGILTAPAHQRQGYGLRSLRLICAYCSRHLGLVQVLAVVPSDNAASVALFYATGFTPLCRLPHYIADMQGWKDAILFRLDLLTS